MLEYSLASANTLIYNSSFLEKDMINGFKIICRLDNDRCIATCKECNKDWGTNYYTLKKIKSCGCIKYSQLKSLPDFINGFKIVKCHGYDTKRGVRWATVECKICKRIYDVDPNKLQYRKHCGCMKKDIIASKNLKDYPGMIQSYKHMIQRCYNKKNKDYKNYGARGISICEEWLKDRNNFYEWALINGWKNGLTIERNDNDKGYCPENCRWVPMCEQGKNTRRVNNAS